MSDLISRKAVIEIIHKEIERTSSFAEHETQINIEMAVSELPTAYDVEKVVENIKGLNKTYNSTDNEFQRGAKAGAHYIANMAIDIVKRGGVE